ncbi:MAG: hydroxymethylbilane synthase [Candidatus Rokubacteria bacterium]|nr:hydroxymethylbilane synthase [Candidatus Rokubacteria bacterium]
MIRLGTRGSVLALAQAEAVAARLRALGAEVEVVPIRTEGDRLLEARLRDLGGKGLFVREIEQALLAGVVDCAVHSLKDLPAEIPAGLALAAFPPREDPGDVLVTREGGGLAELPPRAVVGTSSPRRRALALSLRPDLVVEPIRGNVDTRLAKLARGGFDGVIVAAAGLDRLGLRPAHACRLDPEVFVPAVGQGILALEARAADGRVRGLLERLDDPTTRACALAERAYLARLGASCNSPMAAHATLRGADLRLAGLVASEDGRRVVRGALAGPRGEAERLGRGLAEALLARGAAAVAALAPRSA